MSFAQAWGGNCGFSRTQLSSRFFRYSCHQSWFRLFRQSCCRYSRIYFYTRASKNQDCTDSGINAEICRIHSLTFPTNFLTLQSDFSMPLAPSFVLVLKVSCTPSPCEQNYLHPFLRLSLSIQGSQTTTSAVYPCPLPDLGHLQLASIELAFDVVGIDVRHLPAVLRLHVREYRLIP